MSAHCVRCCMCHHLQQDRTGVVDKLSARLAERERRIHHAARKLSAWCADKDQGGLVEAAMALDMRYSLPKRRPKGKR